jgi:hypothetical protein
VRSPALHALLALARPVAFGADAVELALDPGSLGLLEARSTELLQLLASALAAPKVPLTLRAQAEAPAGALSLDESAQKQREDERARRRDEARAHPAVKQALNIFAGAEIKDIKVELE